MSITDEFQKKTFIFPFLTCGKRIAYDVGSSNLAIARSLRCEMGNMSLFLSLFLIHFRFLKSNLKKKITFDISVAFKEDHTITNINIAYFEDGNNI